MASRSPSLPALVLCGLLGLLSGAIARPPAARAAAPAAALEPSRWHAPAALWLTPDGTTLFAACAKSGELAVIDIAGRRVDRLLPIGESLVALAATSDGNTLALCDAGSNELVIADRDGSEVRVRARVAVATAPVSVTIAPGDRSCYVASLWGRRLTEVDLVRGEVLRAIPLDFSPRHMIFLPDGAALAVADAFGGKLALVDTAEGRVQRAIEMPGHNIGGLGVSPDGKELLVSHMILTESAATTRDNVFWGVLMTSNVRMIPIASLRKLDKNPIRDAQTNFFGDPGHAAGDPNALVLAPDGTALVCLAGVSEVAIGRFRPYAFSRVPVGRRPVAVALARDAAMACVACAHSDTIALVGLAERKVTAEIALGTMSSLGDAEEGERLFYDARLSLDGWFSCHSCHSDGHTNRQNADTFGDGSYGAAKNVLSLLGCRDTGPWGWNGSKRSLEDQVRESMRLTMQPKSPASEADITRLAAYLRTLDPPPCAATVGRDAEAIERGEQVFHARRCASCHVPPSYTSDKIYDVGLDDGPGGNRAFNPPSLRGVTHGAPYLHDGRAKTLEAVFRDAEHKVPADLPDDELNDLLAFLRSL